MRINSLMLIITMFEIINAFGLMMIACEIGQRVNNAFDECSEMVDQLNWYSFPAKTQRILPIIINFAQQPIVFYCFGSRAAVRDTFKFVRIDQAEFYFFHKLV